MSSFLLSLQMNYGCKDSTKYQRYELFKKEGKDTWFAVKWVDILFLYKHQFAVVMTTMGLFSLWAPGASVPRLHVCGFKSTSNLWVKTQLSLLNARFDAEK